MIREQLPLKVWRPRRRRNLMHLSPFCCYCGIGVIEWTGKGAPPKQPIRIDGLGLVGYATLDHIVALVCGGQDSDENTVLACACCNRDKGDMSKE
jgi:5-methylcytosine-specific restriction endonuclease McrA